MKESNYQCGYCTQVQGEQKYYKYAMKNFPDHTLHSCQTERHFISKANCAQLVRILGLTQQLELLKYA